MKVAVLVSLARQVEGEYVFANVIKAHVSTDILKQYLNSSDLPRTGKFNGVDCVMEYGVFQDVEIEGLSAAIEAHIAADVV